KPTNQPWRIGMLEFLGENQEAETALRMIAEQQPDKLDPWLALVRFQATHRPAQGQGQEAATARKQVLAKVEATIAEVKKRVKIAWPELLEAECRRAATDWPAADKAFDVAVRRYPDVHEVQSAGARYFEERGHLDAAGACLQRIVARHPNDRG